MSDAEDLITVTSALAKHVEHGDNLLDVARDLLGKTQNEQTCDARPPEETWDECRRIIEKCGRAIDACKARSKNLR